MRCPYELDVYLIPHLRMKNVMIYCLEVIDETDFSDQQNLEIMYSMLQSAFSFLKTHELIEDTIILERLRTKITAQSGDTSLIDKCHGDRIIDKFMNIIHGIVKRDKTFEDCESHRQFITKSLEDFQRLFTPHMLSEESMFLPLLRQFMGYDELRVVKKTVIKYHDLIQPQMESIDNYKKSREAMLNSHFVHILSSEVLLEIFKLIPQSNLASVSSVCRRWRRLAFSPQLWSSFELKHLLSDFPFSYLINHVLPKVRFSITSLSLADCSDLGEQHISQLLNMCPQVRNLDLSFTSVTDHVFTEIFSRSKSYLSQLRRLNLSGCALIGDLTLKALGNTRMLLLESLDLSGCGLITSSGLLSLVGLDDDSVSSWVLGRLESLNLSGCHQISGPALVQFVESCPRLLPEELYYCSAILDGPFALSANGCTNICPHVCHFDEISFFN